MTPLPPPLQLLHVYEKLTSIYKFPIYLLPTSPIRESQKARCQRCHTYPLQSLLHQTLMVGLQAPVQFRKNSGTLFRPVLQGIQIDAEDIVILMQVYTFALFTFM